MNKKLENNQVTIYGEIVSEFLYSHELYGEKFYLVDVKIQRLSDAFDIIPVTVSERLLDVTENCAGMFVRVAGQFRSYNKREEYKGRVVLSVFAMEMEFVEMSDEGPESNQIYLEGYVCKKPIYRKTPFGREIADLLLAVNRPYGKSDYIPCICWGRNARYVNIFEAGEHLAVWGRIQSREYVKAINGDETQTRIAYEVSISKLEVLKDEKESN